MKTEMAFNKDKGEINLLTWQYNKNSFVFNWFFILKYNLFDFLYREKIDEMQRAIDRGKQLKINR